MTIFILVLQLLLLTFIEHLLLVVNIYQASCSRHYAMCIGSFSIYSVPKKLSHDYSHFASVHTGAWKLGDPEVT